MINNKYLAWTSLGLFALNIILILLFLLFSSVLGNRTENPGVLLIVIGAFSLLGMIMGFLSFQAPQAKVGGIGGLVLLLLVLFVIPVGRETTVTSPPQEAGDQIQAGPTGIIEIDTMIDTALARNPQDDLGLLQFSSLACTHADGLGGPPKCREREEEGTVVEAFPFLGPEGHHVRRSEMGDWVGIRASEVYAVYRNSDQVYSDEAYPAGEYAIVFLIEGEGQSVTAQVRDGKIVRLDTNFGAPSDIDLERVSSEIILAPQR